MPVRYNFMETIEFASRIMDALPFEPTSQQIELIAALARFCSPAGPSDSVFLLNGYAGTGKTSVTGALVRSLRDIGMKAVLLAPTGRAAKVFASLSGHPASTIHRRIYRQPGLSGLSTAVSVAENRSVNTLFIVDEASMIGHDSGATSLLEDLIHYVYTGTGCRLLLLGDTAQLPPPGCSESPAMNPDVLRSFGLRVTRAVMTQTVRQSARSGMLYNATWLRRHMSAEALPDPVITASPFADTSIVAPEDLQDAIDKTYAHYGIAETLLITRSNRRAVQFNQAIRTAILEYETELTAGEPLMVAKNNYYWTQDVKGLDFIANGDILTVRKVYGTEKRGNLRFADVAVSMPDSDTVFDVKIILSALTSESPSLDAAQQQELLDMSVNDPDRYAADTPPDARMRGLKTDPYFNALQVKYAYAVTCHKAQGGQWSSVFVDMGMIQPEALRTIEFYRWLYTATTRATRAISYVSPAITVK